MIQVLAVMSSHAGILHCSSDLGKVPNTDNSVLCFIYNPYLSRSINTWEHVCSGGVLD